MENIPNKIVIIGATSAIAKECARQWATNSAAEFVLVGRDKAKLDVVSADLSVRSPGSKVISQTTDFFDVEAIQSLVDSIYREGPVDIVLIAHGSLPDQSECEANLAKCSEAIMVNALSPVLFAEAFAGKMQKLNKGTIAIIGSVAGDRGRKSNYVYGASKGLVDRYSQGLQHRLAEKNVRVVLIKPGPTDTPMTSSFKASGVKLAPLDVVAKQIVKGIIRGDKVLYVPGKWRFIMLIIRHLPSFVFNKLNI